MKNIKSLTLLLVLLIGILNYSNAQWTQPGYNTPFSHENSVLAFLSNKTFYWESSDEVRLKFNNMATRMEIVSASSNTVYYPDIEVISGNIAVVKYFTSASREQLAFAFNIYREENTIVERTTGDKLKFVINSKNSNIDRTQHSSKQLQKGSKPYYKEQLIQILDKFEKSKKTTEKFKIKDYYEEMAKEMKVDKKKFGWEFDEEMNELVKSIDKKVTSLYFW